MNTSSKLTEDFLHCLSSHLSGRPDCRQVEYVVSISDDVDSGQYISMQPPGIQVFPSRYDRQPHSKLPVIEHILINHFYSSVYDHRSEDGAITVEGVAFVPGKYCYALSADRKRRRWRRVE